MIRVTAFAWAPPFAEGLVRDLRVRWALEEAGLAYEERLIHQGDQDKPEYRRLQPFGQVPFYEEDGITLFESGAIVLHIGRRFGSLVPADPEGAARATAWVIAALNSVEPFVAQLPIIDVFHRGEAWTVERRPQVVEMVERRLGRLSDWLGDKEWLEGDFSAGDLLMIDVLRIARDSGVLTHPNLVNYVERGTRRSAFRRAYEAQLADFEQRTPLEV
jgi:glutathione S-transferase